MKIVTIIGARPQFIKSSVVSLSLKKRLIEEVVIHTGQHYDNNMSSIFFDEMKIPNPKYFLNINNLNHGAMLGKMVEEIEIILLNEHPSYVLLYGDTNSTLAGALAASKLNIKIIHIEAGLRSFNTKMPEEVNRILTDRVSSLLFCPSFDSYNNLVKEGYLNFNSKIFISGDVMMDTTFYYKQFSRKPVNYNIPSKFVLCTIHREDLTNNYNDLYNLLNILNNLSDKINIVIPLHPRTKSILSTFNFNFKNTKIIFIDPIGYLEMLWCIENSLFIMTDSGGLQKEAYYLDKYCITLRSETEWVELVDNKYNFLIHRNEKLLFNTFNFCLENKPNFNNKNIYGSGNSSDLIVDKIIEFNN